MTDPTIIVPVAIVPMLKRLWNAGLSALECGQELGLVGDPNQIREAVIREYQRSMSADNNSWWTDERIATLIKLRAEGLSASEIERKMGATSRSAILGKIKRLGLSDPEGRKTAARARAELKGAKRPSRQQRWIPKSTADADPMFTNDGIDGTPAPEDLEIPVERRRSLLGPPHGVYPELQPRECLWPVGDTKDAAFFFCGDARYSDKPYCIHHYRRSRGVIASRGRAA